MSRPLAVFSHADDDTSTFSICDGRHVLEQFGLPVWVEGVIHLLFVFKSQTLADAVRNKVLNISLG